ncbi:unnamed protein product [Parajaminaea phylloscopi]
MAQPASTSPTAVPGVAEAGDGSGSLSSVAAAGMLPLVTILADAAARDPKAIWSSFSMIIFSEIGDKTFLIAAILAMRHSRLVVFAGAFASLAVMSVLSAALGAAFPSLLPKSLTTLLASLLFFVFGAKMWLEGRQMSGDEMGEEWEEAKKEIEEEEAEEHELRRTGDDEGDIEQGRNSTPQTRAAPRIEIHTGADEHSQHHSKASTGMLQGFKEGTRNLCGLCFSPVFGQAFVLTFLGEWGDRSQIATIALAAAHNVTLVSLGTIAGHSLCTALAVLGGAWLASRISPKHITLGGAALFLLFGFIYLFESWEEYSTPSAVVPAPLIPAPTAVVGM